MRPSIKLMYVKIVLSFVLTAFFSYSASAEVRTPAIFADHMVIQRDLPVHVWGLGAPGEEVRVSFRGASRTATADRLGQWQAYLPAGGPGGPFTLEIAGTNKLSFSDIFVGDVWIASGQSNMEFQLRDVANAEAELGRADQPAIRLCKVNHTSADYPMSDVAIRPWTLSTRESAAKFSAVAFLFAQEIHADQKVAIGVIEADWDGTVAEAWTSLPALASDAALMPEFAAFAKLADGESAYRLEQPHQEEQIARAKAEGKPIPEFPWRPEIRSWIPSADYNGMIAPLTPFPIRGAIWYQGESNAGPERAPTYHHLFETMIRDWRSQWKIGDFPFFYVQLANWKADPETMWPTVRDAQRRTLELKNTGMAVTIDIGNPDNIHPTNKQDVGHRLALAARAIAYGETLEYSGPLYRLSFAEGSSLRVAFTHGSGLVAKGGELHGFEVAGADHKFVSATATIEHDSVVVSSSTVASPVYVRYGWDSNPDCNLYNAAGLPASPFTSEP
ncbi:MAG: sialate O-acetylesterase [Candidatus Acidiferrum sp.]